MMALLAALMCFAVVVYASETALFSLRPWRVERLRHARPATGRLIAELLRDPRTLVICIAISAEIVDVGASNLVAELRRRLLAPHIGDQLSLVVGVIVTSVVLSLVCELGPKTIAVTFPDAVAARLARPIWLLNGALKPLTLPLAKLTSRLTERSRARVPASTPAPLTEEDFRTLVDYSRTEGTLKPAQAEMIEAAFRLGDMQVRQVMTPRPDMIALSESASPEEALDTVRNSRHSRIPVFGAGLDEIIGVLYAKDLLSQRYQLVPQVPIKEMLRPALFVPELMRARQLVHELQARRVHLAIVVDEYGSTAGIVSLEDLLEEMVGEFADEFERPVRLFKRLRRGTFWVRASMPLPEFARRVRARIKEREVDSVGGYVLKLMGRVPVEGDSVSDGRFDFTVRRMKGRRILVLVVQRRQEVRDGSGASHQGDSGRQGPGEKEAPEKADRHTRVLPS